MESNQIIEDGVRPMVHGTKHGQIQNVRAEMEAASIHYDTASPALHPSIIAFEQRAENGYLVPSCLVPRAKHLP